MNQNDDSWEVQFRVDIARQLEQRKQSGNREHGSSQKYCAAIAAACPYQVHGRTRTLDFSGKPYPPVTTTVVPSSTPSRISARSPDCTPTFTATDSASSPVTLYT